MDALTVAVGFSAADAAWVASANGQALAHGATALEALRELVTALELQAECEARSGDLSDRQQAYLSTVLEAEELAVRLDKARSRQFNLREQLSREEFEGVYTKVRGVVATASPKPARKKPEPRPERTCPECHGSGDTPKHNFCGRCNGNGTIPW